MCACLFCLVLSGLSVFVSVYVRILRSRRVPVSVLARACPFSSLLSRVCVWCLCAGPGHKRQPQKTFTEFVARRMSPFVALACTLVSSAAATFLPSCLLVCLSAFPCLSYSCGLVVLRSLLALLPACLPACLSFGLSACLPACAVSISVMAVA